MPEQHTRWLRPALGCLVYAAVWLVLWELSRALWFLPAGLRLGVLWATPQRYWGWLAATEWIGLSLFAAWSGHDALSLNNLLLNTLPWVLYAGSVALLRGNSAQQVPDAPLGMARMLGAGLLAATLTSPIITLNLPAATGVQPGLVGAFGFLFGDFVGQVMLAPLLVLLLAKRDALRQPALLRDLALALIPALVLMALLMRRPDASVDIAFLVPFPALLFLAFRHGWVGPVLGLPLIGVVTEFLVRLDPDLFARPALQVGLAITGAGALMLGASTTALRSSHQLLAQRNRELSGSNESLQRLMGELREMSQRLTRLQEQGQREMAAELHDELGQSVTALATRISLGLRKTTDPEQRVLLESLRAQVGSVHDSLRRVLRQLRPAVLDAYGLQRALSEGPPRELLEDARVDYQPHFTGEVDALDEDTTTAIYRICQEAVTNCVRHAHASRFELRLEVRRESEFRRHVRLQIRDDGIGVSRRQVSGGYGLAGIRSRVLGLDGRYEFTTGPGGTIHHIELVTSAD